MAVRGWVLDKSAAARSGDQQVSAQLNELAGSLHLCQISELEQLYSARSADDYDGLKSRIHRSFDVLAAPGDLLDRALALQRDLAHHHGMWHRTPIPDLLIAETALFHDLGVVHVDADYERIAEVRGLVVRRLG
ncbi:MAG TPA: PIN domain-containing protein [Acidimicrobiales bacterium]|nr:PIN domain-containing protein [Acidimicrobiales bacterium]